MNSQTNASGFRRLFVYAATTCFAVYVGISLFQFGPHFSSMSGAELFSVVKHLVVITVLSIYLFFDSKWGSLCMFAWGAIVPFERYQRFFGELFSNELMRSGTFAVMDMVRILILLAGTIASGILAYMHFSQTAKGSTGRDRAAS